jgi:hypothetical protein
MRKILITIRSNVFDLPVCCCNVWVLHLPSPTRGRIQADGAWAWGIEGNICAW